MKPERLAQIEMMRRNWRYVMPHVVDELIGEIKRLHEAHYEVANRAANMMDADAGTWMPSVYKIACEASGEDPWPLLKAAGFNPETLPVTPL